MLLLLLLLLLLLSRFSCVRLCDPIDGSPPGSPVPGILQARTLKWVCHFLLQCMKVKSQSKVAQSYPTPSDTMDCSLPGSSVYGIFQARVLEWGARNPVQEPHLAKKKPRFDELTCLAGGLIMVEGQQLGMNHLC